MDIRSSLDGLKTLLGVTPSATAVTQAGTNGQAADTDAALASTDRATVSTAGSEMAQVAAEATVRAEKVAEIQAELAAGTYNVQSSAVATKVVDSMLERGR